MDQKGASRGGIEWLVSCALKGGQCKTENETCQRYKTNYRVYGGYGYVKIHPEFCVVYQLPIVDGMKCSMCIDVCKIDNLDHLKGA